MVFQNPTRGSQVIAEHRLKSTPAPRSHDLAELKSSAPHGWMGRVENRAADVADHAQQANDDFDIVAWFAMDEKASAERRMTECWYG